MCLRTSSITCICMILFLYQHDQEHIKIILSLIYVKNPCVGVTSLSNCRKIFQSENGESLGVRLHKHHHRVCMVICTDHRINLNHYLFKLNDIVDIDIFWFRHCRLAVKLCILIQGSILVNGDLPKFCFIFFILIKKPRFFH